MAGIDQSSLGRSLKSAEAVSPLPCARSLVAQGFDPVAVMSWSETGGIPEDAAPYILEHYGHTAFNPSKQARGVLLGFSRVGINAYLKDKLGLLAPTPSRPELHPSFVQGMEAARIIADAVKYVGGDANVSMARSLTVIGREHPDQRKLCFESQRLLCPGIEEFVNATELLEGLKEHLSEETIKLLTAKAKEAGWITRMDPRHLVNALLKAANLQTKGGKRRGEPSYYSTEEGRKLCREETRPANDTSGDWVPQLLWLKNETVRVLITFVSTNFSVSKAG